MSCPDPRELDELFATAPADPARTTALIAHVRGCPRCQEATAEPRDLPPRKRARPTPRLLVLAALGLSLVVLGRACGPSRTVQRPAR